jgi:hypothetical protein
MTHLLIIGGSDAALRARELNPETQVTVVVADSYPNFSICGLPFFISGEVGVCWVRKWWATGGQKSPSGSTSLPPRFSTGWRWRT